MDEPQALKFVREPHLTEIRTAAAQRDGVREVAISFEAIYVDFGDGTTERFAEVDG